MMSEFVDRYKNLRVLVTGGAGFVGSNLVHALVSSGADVTVLDNFHPDYGANQFNLEEIEDKDHLKVIHGSICDEHKVREAMQDIDLVFHAAAQCSHVDSMVNPWLDLEFNNLGSLRLLEEAKIQKTKRGTSPRFVYVSTRAVVGAPLQNPASENVLPNPTDVYGVNKMAVEYYGAVYARVHGIPFVTARLTNCYGPRHQMRSGKYGILNWFMSLALQKKPIKIFGTGEQLRDYLHIDDAVGALLRCGLYAFEETRTAARVLDQAIPYSIFNLASGNPLPFKECAKMLVDRVPSSTLEFVPWPADRKAIETGDLIAETKLANEILKRKPMVSFEKGLDRTLEFYQRFLKHYL